MCLVPLYDVHVYAYYQVKTATSLTLMRNEAHYKSWKVKMYFFDEIELIDPSYIWP